MESLLTFYSLKYSDSELNADIIDTIAKKYMDILRYDVFNPDNVIFFSLIFCKSGDVYSTNLTKYYFITYFKQNLDIRSINIKLSYYGKYDITRALIKRPDNTWATPDGHTVFSFNGKIYDDKYLNKNYLNIKDIVYKSSIDQIDNYVSL